MIDDDGDAQRVHGFALGRPKTSVEPALLLLYHSKHNGCRGAHAQNRCNVAALNVTVNIFQDDLFVQLFFTLHDACFAPKSMLTGDGRTPAGQPSFLCVMLLLCAVLKYSNSAVNVCCFFEQ